MIPAIKSSLKRWHEIAASGDTARLRPLQALGAEMARRPAGRL
jgi:hypothetical protein